MTFRHTIIQVLAVLGFVLILSGTAPAMMGGGGHGGYGGGFSKQGKPGPGMGPGMMGPGMMNRGGGKLFRDAPRTPQTQPPDRRNNGDHWGRPDANPYRNPPGQRNMIPPYIR